MFILKLRRYPDPVLSEKCEKVELFDDMLAVEARQMALIMAEEKGAGLAANQVGLLKRLIVMLSEDGSTLAMVNPVIRDKSGSITLEEGCLSLPGIRYELTGRAESVIVGYQNLSGAHSEANLSGFYALCVQHEIDHLDGLTMLDRLSPLKATRAKTKLAKGSWRPHA